MNYTDSENSGEHRDIGETERLGHSQPKCKRVCLSSGDKLNKNRNSEEILEDDEYPEETDAPPNSARTSTQISQLRTNAEDTFYFGFDQFLQNSEPPSEENESPEEPDISQCEQNRSIPPTPGSSSSGVHSETRDQQGGLQVHASWPLPEISTTAATSRAEQARKILLNYLSDPSSCQRLKNFVLHDLIGYLLSTGEYQEDSEGMKELKSLVDDKNHDPFLAQLTESLVDVKKLIGAEQKKIKIPIKVENERSVQDQPPSVPVPEQDLDADVPIFPPLLLSIPSVGVNALQNDCIYDKLARVSTEVFALMCTYSLSREVKKMISACGKVLFSVVFSREEILSGNPAGRKRPNSTEPVHKYDPLKIVTIEKFLAWMMSQPDDRSIENFVVYEASVAGVGLNDVDRRYFWDNVIVKYSSDLRSKYQKENDGNHDSNSDN